MSISKSEVSKYRTVNDCETRRRQPLALVFKALWAKWRRRQSDQICRWISQGFYSKYRFTIIVSQAFLYHSSMCSYLTDSKILLWWTKILPYDKIFHKCLMTPPNVLNVSNYFNSMIYKIWYWQINILWYSKYKIRKFRENWINLVAAVVQSWGKIICCLWRWKLNRSNTEGTIHSPLMNQYMLFIYKISITYIKKPEMSLSL